MAQPEDIQLKQPIPSKQDLAKATAIALFIAGILLATVVLPAEYGIDPLGTGRMLGLTALSAPQTPLPEETAANAATLVPAQEGPVTHYPAQYKFDSTEFTIGPYDYVEYKYRLEQGASMQYAWSASGELIQDFHGEREGGGEKSEESYDKRQRHQAFGSLAAPFAGIHGWYWENPGATPITVRLKTSGFYSAAVEIRSDRTRHTRELTPLEKVIVSSGAASGL
jgi:hypothetical protein